VCSRNYSFAGNDFNSKLTGAVYRPGISLSGYFFRIALVCSLLFIISFSELSAQEITTTPVTDSICVDFPLTVSYNPNPHPWGPGSKWKLGGRGSASDDAAQVITATWSTPGNKTITATVKNGPGKALGTYQISMEVVAQPTGPGLNTQIPAGAPCDGELVSATFIAGMGGVGCSDEYQYSTRTGAVWSGPATYTPGQDLLAVGYDEIIIEGRRANCNGTVGCSGTGWVTLAQWTIIADATPPVITLCAADKFYNAGPTCQVTVPDLTSEVTATDNCDPAPLITQSPLAGSFIGEGVTTVTLTVTDAGNNIATCTADITVTDITDPVISGCPVDINTTADNNYCGANVSWTAPTASDNCPGVVLTSTHNPGDSFPLGTTTVTYTATDASGLTDICTFDVIVAAAAVPVITGPTEVCTPVQEIYSVVDPGSHTFIWVVTNGTIVGSDTNPAVTVDWTGTIQGTVSVQITSGSGCTNSNNITVDKGVTPATGNINSSNSLTRR
jgi:hypothetical protein